MTVAEEVHFLYPESQWALKRVAEAPAHRFFKQFGEAMPEEDWNHPGTKQGVYMIGPDAEYLEGGGAISGNARRVRRRLRRALERWERLRREKKYANEKVPGVSKVTPPEAEEKALTLRVFLRDLPRGPRDDSGRRFTKADRRGSWLAFTEWAWNVNWIAFDDAAVFVTASERPTPVEPKTARRLCREVLVDNVRGQTPAWKRAHVREVVLTVRRIAIEKGQWILEFRGRALMKSETQSFAPKLHGRATWNPKEKRFERFELLALGQRSGRGRFNQRNQDLGPAPMGVALVLHR